MRKRLGQLLQAFFMCQKIEIFLQKIVVSY